MTIPPQKPPASPPGQPGQPGQIRLELPSNLTATYANAAMVSQTHSEIILDFLQILPNDPRARVQSRVAMTPANAKLFMQALQQNLERFEEKHGEISLPPKPISLADQLFGTVKSDDDTPGVSGG
jgi:predicted secreted Zn-dependent protease